MLEGDGWRPSMWLSELMMEEYSRWRAESLGYLGMLRSGLMVRQGEEGEICL